MTLTNDIFTDEGMAQRMVMTLQSVRKFDYDQAVAAYMNECQFFDTLLKSSENNLESSMESRHNVFLDVIMNNLSFSPMLDHVYVQKNNVKIKKNPDVWDKRLVWDLTPDGDAYLCQLVGSISHLTPPQLVYMGDKYQEYTYQGKLVINHARTFQSNIITSCFVHVVLPDGTREAYSLTVADDITRLMGYSERKNRGSANALYTSNNGQIDKGFFFAKVKKHALKGFRKKAIQSSTLLQSDINE